MQMFHTVTQETWNTDLKAWYFKSSGMFITRAGCFIHLSLHLSRFHFPANSTNTPAMCFYHLSQVLTISPPPLTRSSQCDNYAVRITIKDAEAHKRARCHNNQHSALNGWQITAAAVHHLLFVSLAYIFFTASIIALFAYSYALPATRNSLRHILHLWLKYGVGRKRRRRF